MVWTYHSVRESPQVTLYPLLHFHLEVEAGIAALLLDVLVVQLSQLRVEGVNLVNLQGEEKEREGGGRGRGRESRGREREGEGGRGREGA